MLRYFENPGFVRVVVIVAAAVVGFAILFGRYEDSPVLTDYLSSVIN